MLGLGLGTSKGGMIDALALATNTKSIDFDGTDDILTLPASSSLGNANLSISAWFKTTSSDRIYLFQLIRSGSTTSTSVAISLNQKASDQSDVEGYITGIVYGSSHGYYGSSSSVNANDGNWHHIVLTITDGSQKMYLDSQEIASGTLSYTASFSGSAGNIGNDQSNSYEIVGNVDEVAIWHDILTQNEVTQIYNSGKATLDLSTDTGNYVSSSNIKGWWRMGDEASTRVSDANANNLVIPDMRKTFFTGKSIDFDGSDDWVEVGDAQLMTTAGTVSVWVFVKSGTSAQSIVNKYNAGTGNREFRITIESDEKPRWNVQSAIGSYDSNTAVKSGTALSANTWNHIVGTFSANNAPKLYVNGSLVATASSNIDADGIGNGNSPIFLGRGINNTSITEKVNAGTKITDVAIWDAELNVDTISSIYNSGEPNNLTLSASYTAGSGVDKSGDLQAYWRMGNGSIDAFSNSSLTGIGLIADYTNATLGTALVPNLSDNGDYDGADDSNWTLTTASEWTVNTNTSTAFEATTDSDISGSAECRLYVNSSNSGLSANLPVALYKVTGTLSTTGTLPNTYCRFVTKSLGSYTYHVLSAGNFELYTMIIVSSNNHYFMFKTYTEGHNFKLENVKFEPVNGNAGITVNTSQYDLVDHAPNRNSGDMINFDGSDIETDTPVEIHTVANTKSILFDGGDDFIQAGIINSGNSFTGTFSAWVKRSTTDTGDFIYDGRGSSNGGSGYFRFLADDGASDDDKLDSQGSNTIYVDGVATTTCSAGVWHHVVVAGQTIEIDEDIKIGASKSGGSNFIGNIDEVAIWNTTLTASQVSQIYHLGKANFDLSQNGGGYTSASNLQAWWRMGDGTLDEHPLVADQTDLTLASDIVQNGNFESAIAITSSGFPNHNFIDETTQPDNDITISTDTSNPRNGSQCMKLTLSGSTSGEANYKIENLSAGIYKIVVFARNGVSQDSAKIRLGGATGLRAFTSADSGKIDLTDDYQEIVAYLNKTTTSNFYFAIGITNGTDGHHILVDDFSVQKFNGNAGLMTNMASDAIETDTP